WHCRRRRGGRHKAAGTTTFEPLPGHAGRTVRLCAGRDQVLQRPNSRYLPRFGVSAGEPTAYSEGLPQGVGRSRPIAKTAISEKSPAHDYGRQTVGVKTCVSQPSLLTVALSQFSSKTRRRAAGASAHVARV